MQWYFVVSNRNIHNLPLSRLCYSLVVSCFLFNNAFAYLASPTLHFLFGWGSDVDKRTMKKKTWTRDPSLTQKILSFGMHKTLPMLRACFSARTICINTLSINTYHFLFTRRPLVGYPQNCIYKSLDFLKISFCAHCKIYSRAHEIYGPAGAKKKVCCNTILFCLLSLCMVVWCDDSLSFHTEVTTIPLLLTISPLSRCFFSKWSF